MVELNEELTPVGIQQKIAIAASFTAEPIEDALTFWMATLGMDAEIAFAPYHQIYQELLDPNRLLGQNRAGINVILIRFEDWQRSESDHDAAPQSATATADILRNARDFVEALKSAAGRTSTPYVVCFCPPSPNLEPECHGMFSTVEEDAVAQLQTTPGVYPVASAEITRLYPEASEYDAKSDRLGHIPYTPVAFAALATILARKIRALKWPPYKVIALDCDQTLWRGVVGEDGPLGVKVDAPREALQRFLLTQRDAGTLLCLCSKNVEEDVFEVLDTHPDMLLRRKDIVSSKINWQPKSQNLRSLAAELSLGLDSFVFVDDNPIECSEVEAACPEVLTLLLPAPEGIPHLLKHVWAFDTLKVTEEDRKRSELYRQNVQREAFQGTAMSFQEFLDGLGLEIEIAPMGAEHLARVSQLTQRTNQFNCTTIRRTEAEIKSLCESSGYGCLIVNVKDRFGDYGLVGAVLFTSKSDALYVDTLLLSCRVLGRGVEHRILARLGEIARERGASRVDVAFRPTKKNRPALDFLKVGESFQQAVDDGFVFRLPVDFAMAVQFVPGGTPQESAEEAVAKSTVAPPSADGPSRPALLRKIAEEWNNTSSILKAVEAQRQRLRPDVDEVYVAPRSPLEASLAEIWSCTLGVEQVGVRDDFFALGGGSLLAVRVFTEIEKSFGQSLPITTLLTAPTIEKLGWALENRTGSKMVSALVPIQPLGSRPPFFCVHGARGKVLGFRSAALCLGLDQPYFGLQATDLEDHEVAGVTIEALAAKYLEAIRAEYPNGPYLLGGNCFGSLVALEMARMLREQHQEVALLALFDPPQLSPRSFVRFAGITLRSVASQVGRMARRPLRENIAYLGTVIGNLRTIVEERWAGVFPARAQVGTAETGPEVSIPRQIHNIFLANMRAVRMYQPQPYAGAVSLFLARENSALRNAICEAEWKNLAKGGVEVHIVPSSHGAFFDEPDVQAFSAMFATALGRASRGAVIPARRVEREPAPVGR
jgi:FkbH-like protein